LREVADALDQHADLPGVGHGPGALERAVGPAEHGPHVELADVHADDGLLAKAAGLEDLVTIDVHNVRRRVSSLLHRG